MSSDDPDVVKTAIDSDVMKTAASDRPPDIRQTPISRAFLRYTANDGGEASLELRREDKVVLGRSTKSTIPLNSEMVSRFHSRIFYSNGDYCIEDLNSTNGTKVNGVHVARCALRNDDLIEVGSECLRYVERPDIENSDE